MGRRSQTAEGPTDPELFVIELESLERDFDEERDAPAYAAAFVCSGPDGSTATAYVMVLSQHITTLQIVPQAMSELHLLFAALAEQTRGWLVEEKG